MFIKIDSSMVKRYVSESAHSSSKTVNYTMKSYEPIAELDSFAAGIERTGGRTDYEIGTH
ncbi:hypothetical protein KSX_51450 [Ktedonospora formicarum]|uniref:Uncharacterized protein n=1 Tax=Ktedonospora formicarum TaxID=2778364 RepID=A0A8J3HZA5_9CHLR|nr:hypothetical protein KSX_51450 [Ktedonospora formicarum]